MKRNRVRARENRAAPRTARLCPQDHLITGSYDLWTIFIIHAEISCFFFFPGFRKREAATGSHVRPNIIAPMRAKEKAIAIGWNIFPSTPLNERMGMKTINMITCPKMAEFIIFDDPEKETLSRSACFSSPDTPVISSFFIVICNAIYSTMMTAPSIIIPKSRAPRLIRLASIPNIYIIDMVNNNARGIIEAITMADRRLPNNRSTIKNTISAPSIRFSATVADVSPISSLLSSIGFMNTPSGRFC